LKAGTAPSDATLNCDLRSSYSLKSTPESQPLFTQVSLKREPEGEKTVRLPFSNRKAEMRPILVVLNEGVSPILSLRERFSLNGEPVIGSAVPQDFYGITRHS